jgi:hypothetical protein
MNEADSTDESHGTFQKTSKQTLEWTIAVGSSEKRPPDTYFRGLIEE